MAIKLKGGATTEDVRLDRVYQLDLRSLNFLVDGTQRRPRSYTWKVGQWLDQGREGACVGFGFSHDLVARPVSVAGITDKYAQAAYWEAQRTDEWPGGSYPGATPKYEGSSVLAGAQVMAKFGFYNQYRWAITALDVAGTIGYEGPCILGIAMYDGMMNPNADGFLVPSGKLVGGHCILANAVKFHFKGVFGWMSRGWPDVDLDKSYITVWNSWGPSWGKDGTAKISIRSLMQLIEVEHGEACFPQRNTKKVML